LPAKPTLVMRLMAGLWFSITVGIVAFSWVYLEKPPRDLPIFLWFVILPTVIAGLCGWTLGAPILLGLEAHATLMAALRGVTTFSICFAILVVIIALRATLATSREFSHFLGLVIWVIVFWALNKVIGVVIIGAVAGLVLYRCRRLFAK
jgi:hypothetical protein